MKHYLCPEALENRCQQCQKEFIENQIVINLGDSYWCSIGCFNEHFLYEFVQVTMNCEDDSQ
jgi:hypothetical protein